MLYEFLKQNEKEILAMTEEKSLALAGIRQNSVQLKAGLPIFYGQMILVLEAEAKNPRAETGGDSKAMATAAGKNDEEAMAQADGRPDEAAVAKSAGLHGEELLRLGYTLSHVVHAYGSMCQSITELATIKKTIISPSEFHHLNRCLDTGIAGAVTQFQSLRNNQNSSREIQHLGALAHELRNSLASVKLSFQLMKEGTVGFGGSVAQVLENGLNRMDELIERSLTEVRMRIDPVVRCEAVNLLELFEQISITATEEARKKDQIFEIQVEPTLVVEADQQLLYSAISNLVQNGIKFTPRKGRIQVRALELDGNIVIEVQDECGGLKNPEVDLFKAFEQQNENKKGLGLGLTITQRAIQLNGGTIAVNNLPGKGCRFKITLPKSVAVPINKII